MDTPFAGLVETDAGPAFVETVGTGTPMVVVHGGPGFDHTYLKGPLAFLARRRTLVFFDQLGCGRTPAPPGGADAAATFRHFRALLDRLDIASLGIIAHSWGALVAVAAMAEAGKARTFREAIFVNPTPLTGAAYSQARNEFSLSLPPDKIAEVTRLIMAGAPGAEVFAIVLPYYFGKTPAGALPRLDVTTATYLAVDASIGPFDATPGLAAFPRLSLIRGEKDFIREELIGDLLARAGRVVRLPGIGHFPAYEAPAEFEAAVTGLLGAH